MSEKSPPEFATWLPVIGRSLAYLCLTKAMEDTAGAEKYKSIIAKVNFMEGLGLPHKDAAEAAGTTTESVRVAKFKKESKAKNGTPKKAKARGGKR
jgi:hypothetical protein